jgi:hypothetical protein
MSFFVWLCVCIYTYLCVYDIIDEIKIDEIKKPDPVIVLWYIHMCVCVWIFVCVSVCVCVCIYMCVCVYMYVYIIIYICVCMYIDNVTNNIKNLDAHIVLWYIYMCVCLFVCVCM